MLSKLKHSFHTIVPITLVFPNPSVQTIRTIVYKPANDHRRLRVRVYDRNDHDRVDPDRDDYDGVDRDPFDYDRGDHDDNDHDRDNDDCDSYDRNELDQKDCDCDHHFHNDDMYVPKTEKRCLQHRMA